MLHPFPTLPPRVVRIADRRYGPHRRNRLDVYHRRDRPEGGRVLLYLHGGGYFSGGKHREGRALLHQLASRGWVCVSADYRLRPSAAFEDHLADARAAVGWARAHAPELGGDPRRLVVAGSSAGAHLASLLALDPSAEVDAAVCLYGYYDRYYGRDSTERVASTPFALPASTAPPFMVVHGDRDSWTPVERAHSFAQHVRGETSNPVVEVVLPGGQHGFDLWCSWRGRAVIAAIERFLDHPSVDRTTRTNRVGP